MCHTLPLAERFGKYIIYGDAHSVMVIVQKIDTTTRLQILDEAVYFYKSLILFGKLWV